MSKQLLVTISLSMSFNPQVSEKAHMRLEGKKPFDVGVTC